MLSWTLTSPVATFGGYWAMDGAGQYYWVPDFEGDEPTEPPPGSGGTGPEMFEWHGGVWIIDGVAVEFTGTSTYQDFIPDADGDGLPDDWDPHPYDAANNSHWFGGGTWAIDGVLQSWEGLWLAGTGPLPDDDNDGLPDDWDPHPYDPANNTFEFSGGIFTRHGLTLALRSGFYAGSGVDGDEDGFPDDLDDRFINPASYGALQSWAGGTFLINGAPSTYGPLHYFAPAVADTDADGIPDELDAAPEDPWNGTYFHWSGGVFHVDGVPTTFAPRYHGGLFADGDGDTLPDVADPYPADPANNSAWWSGGTFTIDGIPTEFPGQWHRANAGDGDNDGIPEDMDPYPGDPNNPTLHQFIWQGGTFIINGQAQTLQPGTHPGVWADTDEVLIPDSLDPWPNDPSNNSAWWQGGTFTVDSQPHTFPAQWHRANAGDADADGIPDDLDPYPNDPLNPTPVTHSWTGGVFRVNGVEQTLPGGTYPGLWSDVDGDTIPDAADPYPADPANNSLWWPGGVWLIEGAQQTLAAQWIAASAPDGDGDGIPDAFDPHPADSWNGTGWWWPEAPSLTVKIHNQNVTFPRPHHLTPWSDSDGDGIPDIADPLPHDYYNGNDTDADGIPDSIEAQYPGLLDLSDPADAQSVRADGVSHLRAHLYNQQAAAASRPGLILPLTTLIPQERDTDLDTMPDRYEAAYGLNPFDNQDAAGNTHDDLVLLAEKAAAGLNPWEEVLPEDYLAVTGQDPSTMSNHDPVKSYAENDWDGDGVSNVDELLVFHTALRNTSSIPDESQILAAMLSGQVSQTTWLNFEHLIQPDTMCSCGGPDCGIHGCTCTVICDNWTPHYCGCGGLSCHVYECHCTEMCGGDPGGGGGGGGGGSGGGGSGGGTGTGPCQCERSQHPAGSQCGCPEGHSCPENELCPPPPGQGTCSTECPASEGNCSCLSGGLGRCTSASLGSLPPNCSTDSTGCECAAGCGATPPDPNVEGDEGTPCPCRISCNPQSFPCVCDCDPEFGGCAASPNPEIDHATCIAGTLTDPPPGHVRTGELPCSHFILVELAVDADRDGLVTFGSDSTSSDKPFRFWVNDDHDHGVDTEDLNGDRNCDDGMLNGIRDLEDFTVLKMRIGALRQTLSQQNGKIGFRWKDISGGSPSCRIFTGSPSLEKAADYLSTADGAETVRAQNLFVMNTLVSGGSAAWLRSSLLTETSSDEITLLMEGCADGKGKLTLVFELKGQMVDGPSLDVQLLRVGEMYDRGRITVDAPGIPNPWDNVNPPALAWAPDTAAGSPKVDPHAKAKTIIWVHGWRMDYAEYASWGDTSFKRLWQMGFTGRFYAFRWPTFSGENDGLPSLENITSYDLWRDGGLTYNASEYRSWLSGPALANFVNQTANSDSRYLFAHSMGNVISGAALRAGMNVTKYAMCNAAMASMAYDGVHNDELDNDFETIDTDPTPLAAAIWGLSNRFNPTGRTTIVNFALPMDDALGLWSFNNKWFKPYNFLVWGYGYDRWNPYPNEKLWYGNLGGISFVRYLTTDAEAYGYCVQARTRTAGAKLGVGNMSSTVDMSTFGFGDEHSAEWNRSYQNSYGFWKRLMEEFDEDVSNR